MNTDRGTGLRQEGAPLLGQDQWEKEEGWTSGGLGGGKLWKLSSVRLAGSFIC